MSVMHDLTPAQISLKGDELFKLLVAGKATAEDQRNAAQWLVWQSRYVTSEGLKNAREGRIKLSEAEKELLNGK